MKFTWYRFVYRKKPPGKAVAKMLYPDLIHQIGQGQWDEHGGNIPFKKCCTGKGQRQNDKQQPSPGERFLLFCKIDQQGAAATEIK